MTDLGARIRHHRTGLGMTLQDVADRTGRSKPAISRIERGAMNPSIDTLRALADALGVTAGDLLGGAPALTKEEWDVLHAMRREDRTPKKVGDAWAHPDD